MSSEVEILHSLAQELSKRIDALEALGLRFWVPVVISIGALGTSFLAIRQNFTQRKAQALQAIKTNVDVAKAQVETLSMGIAQLVAKTNRSQEEEKELEIKNQAVNSSIERLLNAYNDGCDKFYKKQVDRQDFADLFSVDIALYIKKFPNKFSEPLTSYSRMIEYHRNHIKKVRV